MATKPEIQEVSHPAADITPGMKAEDYVAATLKMREHDKHAGFINGGLLRFARWVGDAGLAVLPKNRFSCAVGLTAGGALGLYTAKLLSGMHLADYTPVPQKDFPKILQPLHGIIKFDPLSHTLRDRWKKLGAFYIFTIVSFLGVMTGAWAAYRNFYKSNENADSLEDYVARIGQHQGSKWRWLAASSSVFGSVSGYYTIPFLPGVNYGSSIAFYTVLNQDRKIMTPGLKIATGTTTNSYLGLREGVDYLCKYAVHNPSKNPAELEYLTLTIMGPLAHAAGIKLTAEHIQKFVNQIHDVRDKYWQQGGIPEAKKHAAMKDTAAHFKGKGLDKAFYDAGFDTMKIDFTKLNGLIGKLGNHLGAVSKVQKEQADYRALATEWRKEWIKRGKEDDSNEIDSLDPAGKSFTTAVKRAPALAATPRPASKQEQVSMTPPSSSAAGL